MTAGRAIFTAGWVLVCLAVVCNEWLLERLLSVDGVIDEDLSRIKIRFFELGALATGLLFIRRRAGLLDSVARHPRIVAVLLGILLGCALTEFAARRVIQWPKGSRMQQKGSYSDGFFVGDDLLGYKPRPNARVSSIRIVGGKQLYHVQYSIDGYSRRITPVENCADRREFAVFFGGSFTFGEGVDDDETMPHYFAEFSRRYRPYNYGFCGYGPQAMLAKIESDEVETEIRERSGILIYTFLDGHVDRAIGEMRVFNAWARDMPYYRLTHRGRLARRGTFTTGRPLSAMLYWTLGRSRALSRLGFQWPLRVGQRHLALTCRIIEQSVEVARSKFHRVEPFVLLYPGSKRASAVRTRLTSKGIHCLDYSRLEQYLQNAFVIAEEDRHPSARGHRAIARLLADNVKRILSSAQGSGGTEVRR